jgi:hypothetical protein
VTFKMETVPDKDGTVIKLIGWLRVEYLPELGAKTGTSSRPVVLEMAEATLVDVEAVRFLAFARHRASSFATAQRTYGSGLPGSAQEKSNSKKHTWKQR